MHKKDGTKEVIRDGWEHEHCDICMATISNNKNIVYMKSNNDDNICLDCFENYILKKNIDFIV